MKRDRSDLHNGHIPRKGLGQNFLVNKEISSRIVSSIPEGIKGKIIEVGPGKGALTRILLERGYKVLALELDSELVTYLEHEFDEYLGNNLEIMHMDCIEYLKSIENPIPFIISNLPYNISTEFMVALMDRIPYDSSIDVLSGALVMVQKEYGERLASSPGRKSYGRISVHFQVKMEHKLHFGVNRGNFYPVPGVDSLVMGFDQRREPLKYMKDPSLFRRIVDSSFQRRRKMLRNTLNPSSLGLDMDEKTLGRILKRTGWSSSRPEVLSPSDFIDLANSLFEENG